MTFLWVTLSKLQANLYFIDFWPPTDLASVEANVGSWTHGPTINFLHPWRKARGIDDTHQP
jgi:hypothetical protein